MSTFGIIYCAYDTADLVPASLQPWIDARRQQLGGHQFKIAAVCVPFANFPHEKTQDNTQQLLEARLAVGEIDTLITSETPMAETEARGRALRWLVDAGVDTLWQVDSDENYTPEEVTRITAFVNSRPHTAWFRGSLKNYVLDEKTYLVEPFTPPRIHRVTVFSGCIFTACGFWDDNNVCYKDSWHAPRPDTGFSSVTIPKSVAWVRHMSWLSNLRSLAKVRYQEARGWNCSFAWDDSQGGLIWRPGQPIPEVARDE